MAKSQEDRLSDLARELAAVWPSAVTENDSLIRQLSERLLLAADREKPKWPTDTSVRAYFAAESPSLRGPNYKEMAPIRNGLRAAFLADPIIKAAIRHRDKFRNLPSEKGCALCHAVNDAGL